MITAEDEHRGRLHDAAVLRLPSREARDYRDEFVTLRESVRLHSRALAQQLRTEGQHVAAAAALEAGEHAARALIGLASTSMRVTGLGHALD